MVDIQSPTAEIRRGKKEELEMWANAQRDGLPDPLVGWGLGRGHPCAFGASILLPSALTTKTRPSAPRFGEGT